MASPSLSAAASSGLTERRTGSVQAAPDAPQLKPEAPQVTATATGTEDRRSTVALFAGAFRCGDKPLVQTAVKEANANPEYLFGTIGWPELVAEIAAELAAWMGAE